jgi:nucleoside-diphosphate-sugar epimerase
MTYNKILVTGAGGFIGYQLSNHLSSLGHEVVGIDRKFPRDAGHANFNSVVCDYRDTERMNRLLKKVELVFHLACAHLEVNFDEAEYWDINVHGIPGFLESVLAAGVEKFIHVSSVGVYGDVRQYPADEQAPCRPLTIYGQTKLAGEEQVRKFANQSGLPTVIVRPSWVFGPTCPRTRKLYRALKKRTFPMIGKGLNTRHPIYILDLLRAFEVLMAHHAAIGDLFIIGGARIMTTKKIVDTVCNVFGFKSPVVRLPIGVGRMIAFGIEAGCRLIGTEPPMSRRSLEFYQVNNGFDISKARRVLGYGPEYTFEQGLRHCAAELQLAVDGHNGSVGLSSGVVAADKA